MHMCEALPVCTPPQVYSNVSFLPSPLSLPASLSTCSAEVMGPTNERTTAKATREALAAEAAVTSPQAYAANVAAVNKYATTKLQ